IQTDSTVTNAQHNSRLTETKRLIEMKNEERRVKQAMVDQLHADREKATNEQKIAKQEKQRQQEDFGQMIAQQRRIEKQAQSEQRRMEARARAEPPAASSQNKKKAADAEVKLSDIAEKRLMKIYKLIEQEKTGEATALFNGDRDMLEAGLDPDAFSTIQMTIISIEPVEKTSRAVARRPEPPPPPEPIVYAGPRKEGSIFLTSLPPVASVFMDGELVGKTNVGYLKITSGPHTMRFVKGGLICTRHMTFVEGKNPSQLVKLPCE
ncbi:MAG: PEGA domain-containing protein, partial [Chitinispirillaceae bacterium]|nr:PEGA domain-containing protein [Chitinispirillaceae bacterium]